MIKKGLIIILKFIKVIDSFLFVFIYTGVLAFVSTLLFIYPVFMAIKYKTSKKDLILGLLGVILSIVNNMRLGLYAFMSEGLYSLAYLYLPLILGLILIFLARNYKSWFMKYVSIIYGIFLIFVGIFYLFSTYILGF